MSTSNGYNISDSIRDLVAVLELKEMGDFPLEAASSPKNIDGASGRQLTEEDQRERFHYLQGKQESGSRESDDKLQERGTQTKHVQQVQPVEGLDPTGIQAVVTRCLAPHSQTSKVLDGNSNSLARPPSSDSKPSSDSNVFSLNSDQSSYMVSKVGTVSADGGDFPCNQGNQSDQISKALPLSSKVSEELSKLSVSSEETSKDSSNTYHHGINHVSLSTTKQEASYVPPKYSADGERPQSGTEVHQMRSTESEKPFSSKNGFLPLISRGETFLTGEEEIDDEICDILILYHENDESHLSIFQAICDKNEWTTRTKDDFPLGELGFQQLDEELDKCLLVVALMTDNFLENGVNSHEHHAALMKSIKEKSKNFIPVVCTRELSLPSHIETMTVGHLNKPSFEKRLKTTVNKAKKKHKSSRQVLPPNNFDTQQTLSQANQQPNNSRTINH